LFWWKTTIDAVVSVMVTRRVVGVLTDDRQLIERRWCSAAWRADVNDVGVMNSALVNQYYSAWWRDGDK